MKLTIDGSDKDGFAWSTHRKGNCVAKAGRSFKSRALALAAFRRLQHGIAKAKLAAS